jgi:hypothetical protein
MNETINEYNELIEKRKKVENKIYIASKYSRSEIGPFLNKIMSNTIRCSGTHEVICRIEKRYSHENIVMTQEGIKSKWGHRSHSRTLDNEDIVNVLLNQEVEDWIKNNKPKLYNIFLEIKNAFLDGFDSKFLENDKSKSEIVKVVERSNVLLMYESSNKLIEQSENFVNRIRMSFSISDSDLSIYMLDDETSSSRELEGGFLSYYSYRKYYKDISMMLDEVCFSLDNIFVGRDIWWANFKKKMEKYSALVNL